MANTVKLKRSAVQNKVPTTTDIDLGELAINTFDGKLYLKKDNGTASIVEVGASASTNWASPGTIGSTTPNTGAFTTLSATGNVSFDGGTFVFNDAGADKDLRIEGDTNANLVFCDASVDRVGIRNGAPAEALDVTGNIKLSGALLENVFTITDAAAFEIDPANGTVQLVTLGANRTPKATNFSAGESVTLMVDDGSARTLTWTDSTFGSGGVTWVGSSAPNLATSGYTVIELWKVSTKVYGVLVGTVA